MRLFFALGPGDVVGDIRRVSAQSTASGETSITFSEQLLRLVQAKGWSALMVSYHPRIDAMTVGAVEVVNRAKRWPGRGGPMFHLSQIAYALTLLRLARRSRADAAFIDSGTTHYFMLTLFRLAGIRVIVNFHNVRWPQGYEPRGIGRLVRALDSWFFRTGCDAVLGCSPECGVQARADGAVALPFFEWRGQYSREGFEAAPTVAADGAFRLMFAGRIERNKGVFDLLEIAERLKSRFPRPVEIAICGDGPALAELREAVTSRGLGAQVVILGRLERDALLAQYRAADAVIVPTRGDFCEGMPLVCAEAMLAGCPVVTSRVSNALPVIGAAIAEAQPEDVDSYVAAITKLATDRDYYAKLQSACAAASQQFLDPAQGYDRAIERAVALIALRLS